MDNLQKKTPSSRLQSKINYQLSDPKFTEVNWTKLPSPALPAGCVTTKGLACFFKKQAVKLHYYAKGQLAAQFNKDGTGKVYYIDGSTAIDLTKSTTGFEKVFVYSKPQSEGTQKCLGWVDGFGNCVIYDTNGNGVLNFNQVGGSIFNEKFVSKWEWTHLTKSGNKKENKDSPPPKKMSLTTKRSVSEELLNLCLRRPSTIKTIKGQSRRQCIHKSINSCIGLNIYSKKNIYLTYEYEKYKIRLDVGVTIVEGHK